MIWETKIFDTNFSRRILRPTSFALNGYSELPSASCEGSFFVQPASYWLSVQPAALALTDRLSRVVEEGAERPSQLWQFKVFSSFWMRVVRIENDLALRRGNCSASQRWPTPYTSVAYASATAEIQAIMNRKS